MVFQNVLCLFEAKAPTEKSSGAFGAGFKKFPGASGAEVILSSERLKNDPKRPF